MHQTKKGNQWYFGMNVHSGGDKDTVLIHSVVTTAANVHDLTQAGELLHGDDEVVYDDDGYRASPNGTRWQMPQRISESRCGQANADPYQRLKREDCKI
jgi:IS5 family transposase